MLLKWYKARRNSTTPENVLQKAKSNKKVEVCGKSEAPSVRWKTYGTKQYLKNPRLQNLRRRTFWSPPRPRPFRSHPIKRVSVLNGRPPCSKFLSGPWGKAPSWKYHRNLMGRSFRYVSIHISYLQNPAFKTSRVFIDIIKRVFHLMLNSLKTLHAVVSNVHFFVPFTSFIGIKAFSNQQIKEIVLSWKTLLYSHRTVKKRFAIFSNSVLGSAKNKIACGFQDSEENDENLCSSGVSPSVERSPSSIWPNRSPRLQTLSVDFPL